jgi:DNA-nicking Smr family endonuclease
MSTGDDKPRRRKLTDEERALWGRITRAVAPLPRPRMIADPADAPATAGRPKARSSAGAQAAARDATAAAKPVPRLEPLDRRLKQRLARGAVEIDARIDLHGQTQSQAHGSLLRFLRKAQHDGARYVLVITGKGARAGDDWSERGVLKRQVPLWLKLPEFRAYVVGYDDAHIGHGGEGALYVRLRRARA